MGKFIDMVGMRYGKLQVVNISSKTDGCQKVYWECLCDCGNVCVVRGGNLRVGQNTSCGRCKIGYEPVEVRVGDVYKKLTVIESSGDVPSIHWICQCECGVRLVVRADKLQQGRIISCGCDKNIPPRQRHIDEMGKVYGELRVITAEGKKGDGGDLYWNCECSCGKKVCVRGVNLRKGLKRSCGCLDKKPYLEEIGNRYGKWMVLALSSRKGNRGEVYFDCRCDCGVERSVLLGSLKIGYSTSCGCGGSKKGSKIFIDQTGKRYGLLFVLDRNHERQDGKTYWNCQCDCGNKTVVRSDKLKGGYSLSCGCSFESPDEIGNTYGKLTVEGLACKRDGEKYWRCRCRCGEEVVKRGVTLKSGKIRACSHSCFSSDSFFETSINQLIHATKQSAKIRNLEYSLTREDHEEIARSNCYYCGIEPSNELKTTRTKRLKIKYSGIDRIDPAKGYVKGNIRSCCIRCNVAKSDMAQGEFIEWISRLTRCFFNKLEVL